MVVATIYSGTGDGAIQSSSGTYSTARTGASLVASPATQLMIAGQELDTSTYFCYESFLAFDTSSLGASANVTVITLDTYLTLDSSTTDTTINARTRDWSSGGLTTADYVAGASVSANTLLATLNSSGIGSTGAYKTFTSQAAFLTAPNLKTGVVYIMLSSSRFEAGTTPTNAEYLTFSTADETGTTQDPKLTITYTSGSFPPMFQRNTPRVWSVY